jgi:uncharacterized protein
MPGQRFRPTTSGERLEILDALRGFALFGILLANLTSFFGYSSLSPAEFADLPTADRFVLFSIDWLIEGKFYTLFSILLGVGFALQAERARESGRSFPAFWRRRMLALLGIGLTHMYVVWNGDILTLYSLLGLLLPLFWSLSKRNLERWILALLLAPLLIHLLLVLTPDHPFWSSAQRWTSSVAARWGYGDRTVLDLRTSHRPEEVFTINVLQALPRWMSYLQSGRYPEVLGMFLVGIWIARTRILRFRRGELETPRGLTYIGIVGLLASFGYACIKGASMTPFAATPLGLFQGLLYHVGAICLALGIAAVFVNAWSSEWLRPYLAKMTVLGRMALTNYILQNVVAVLLFFGYGFGLMGKLSFALIPPVALAILVAQWLFSRAWLRRYNQGPLENLWRRMSYGRV